LFFSSLTIQTWRRSKTNPGMIGRIRSAPFIVHGVHGPNSQAVIYGLDVGHDGIDASQQECGVHLNPPLDIGNGDPNALHGKCSLLGVFTALALLSKIGIHARQSEGLVVALWGVCGPVAFQFVCGIHTLHGKGFVIALCGVCGVLTRCGKGLFVTLHGLCSPVALHGILALCGEGLVDIVALSILVFVGIAFNILIVIVLSKLVLVVVGVLDIVVVVSKGLATVIVGKGLLVASLAQTLWSSSMLPLSRGLLANT
jgi:hypothetical protein